MQRSLMVLVGGVAVSGPMLICGDSSAQDEATAAAIVAAQVRSQGHNCQAPVRATRDVDLSRPDLPVWVLECADARYRVRIIADQAAEITKIDNSD
jgi:hypothetical protein